MADKHKAGIVLLFVRVWHQVSVLVLTVDALALSEVIVAIDHRIVRRVDAVQAAHVKVVEIVHVDTVLLAVAVGCGDLRIDIRISRIPNVVCVLRPHRRRVCRVLHFLQFLVHGILSHILTRLIVDVDLNADGVLDALLLVVDRLAQVQIPNILVI